MQMICAAREVECHLLRGKKAHSNNGPYTPGVCQTTSLWEETRGPKLSRRRELAGEDSASEFDIDHHDGTRETCCTLSPSIQPSSESGIMPPYCSNNSNKSHSCHLRIFKHPQASSPYAPLNPPVPATSTRLTLLPTPSNLSDAPPCPGSARCPNLESKGLT